MQLEDTAKKMGLAETDSHFLAHLRSVSILMIVLGHVGLGWFFKPWSEFITVFVAIFFYISGAVSFHSYHQSKTLGLYYRKRLFGLLIPYFLLCILSLVVYVFLHGGQLPVFDLKKFAAWMQIRPYADTMPFNIGQVWFIHTLVVISLISPFIFSVILYRKKFYLWLILFLLLSLSAVQMFYDIDNYFFIAGNNLYKPLIHTIFFTVGAWCFSDEYICSYKRQTYLLLSCGMVLFCIFLVQQFDLKIGYGYHTYAPDLYYVFGSLATIWFAMSLKDVFVSFVSSKKMIAFLLRVFFVYTMPIFLLHSYSIFICETMLGLVHPEHNFVIYGIVKFSLVIFITLLLSYPFLHLSNFIINWTVVSSQYLKNIK